MVKTRLRNYFPRLNGCLHRLGPSSITGYPREWINEDATGLELGSCWGDVITPRGKNIGEGGGWGVMVRLLVETRYRWGFCELDGL